MPYVHRSPGGPPRARREVVVPAGAAALPGSLRVPSDASGLVIFAHGSGSSRHSSRNQYVAGELQRGGCATLLFDLLEEHEALDRRNVFDVELLGGRVLAAVEWAAAQPELSALPLGLFGASTGAAAALSAAARLGARVAAVVSRGGRPDLAGPALRLVRSPTLLIVGEWDEDVLDLNREALAQLRVPGELRVVRGATHLFEEPGTLEQVADLARGWFARHFAARPQAAPGASSSRTRSSETGSNSA